MKGRRRKIVADESPSLGSQMPRLALFVIMLAFFIMLNSVSLIKEEKAKPLMDSIEEAFASKITANENWQPSTAPAPDMGVYEGRVLDRMEGLFQGHIAGIQTQKDDNRGVLLMRMSYADLSAAVTNIGDKAAQNKKFMETLSSMLRASASGQLYRMDILLQVDDNPAILQDDQPQKMKVLMHDLGALAQQLEKAGLPQRLLSVGLEKGQSGSVELLFRPHEAYHVNDKGAGDDN